MGPLLARAMGDVAGKFSLTAMGQSPSIDGTICIAASESYSSLVLPPIIAKLRILEPGIKVEIVASNSPSDLRRREADIAIRNFRPSEPDLIAKKIYEVPARLYATPSYLDRIGNPKLPNDLRNVEFVDLDRTDMLMNALNTMGMSLTKKNFRS